MKTFSVLAFLVAIIFLSEASHGQNDSNTTFATAPPIDSVYGPAKPVKKLAPWSERQGRVSSSLPQSLRTPERCVFPIDVVIVQDATASFADDFESMRDTQLQAMFKSLRRTHPGSRFGVISFRDKPIWSLGRYTDYCQRIELPLTADTKAVEAVYQNLQSTGGGDFPENQFGALMAAALSTRIGWSSRDSIVTRLIVLATDAPPHFADDGLNDYGMTAFTGLFNETTADAQCTAEYYPTPEHVKQVLWGRQAYLAQLVFDSKYQNGIVGRSWNWFNEFIGQTPEFVEPMLDDASNFWESLAAVIQEIEEVECSAQTTTTPSPTATTSMLTKSVSQATSTHTKDGITGTTKATSSTNVTPDCNPTPAPECETTPPPECPTTTTTAGECKPDCTTTKPEMVIKFLHRPQRLNMEIVKNNATSF